MAQAARRRELGRGDRVLPGVWRLRLPLPWPGVPHCNAWALAAGDGIVLVDTGHARAGLARPPRARAGAGQPAARPRAAARLHPRPLRSLRPGGADRRARRLRAVDAPQPRAHDPQPRGPRRRRSPGGSRSRARAACPRSRCGAWAERAQRPRARDRRAGRARPRPRRRASRSQTDHGTWSRASRPRATRPRTCACSSAERRLLISGDHLLGRVSLFYDYGWTPDPVGEFLRLAGEGRPARRAPVPARPRAAVRRRARARPRQPGARAASASTPSPRRVGDGPLTAFEVVPRVYGEDLGRANAAWWLQETLCYLTHLERRGAVAAAARGAGALGGGGVAAAYNPRIMRIDEIIATRAEPVFSFEFFPPKTEEGERNLQTALRELGPLEPVLRVGHLRRRRIHARPHDRDRQVAQGRARARGHGPPVVRRHHRRRSCARSSTRCATPGSTTCSRCAATRRRARPSGVRIPAACTTPPSWRR